MDIPIMTGALILGILLIVLKFLKVGKTKKTGNIILFFGIAFLAVAGLSYYGYIPQTYTLPTSTLAAIPPTVTTPTLTRVCAVEDTTVTLSGKDKYTAGSSGGVHKYRINGAPALTVADAGTFTASPGDNIEILFGNATTTGTFGIKKSYTVPCSGTVTFSEDSVNNGSLTIRVFNEEGNLITDPENETLAAGDVVNLNWEIQGQYQKEIPYGLVLVVEYNKSTIDDVVISLDGSTLQAISVPVSYSPSYGTDSSKKSYLVPAILSNNKISGTVMIDADDTNNPGSSTDGDLAFTLYSRNYFVNEDIGGAFAGPEAEDEDNTVTRAGKFTYTLEID